MVLKFCRNVGFVDIFEGKGVEDGKRSLTVRLEYRSDERTLVDEEVYSRARGYFAGFK